MCRIHLESGIIYIGHAIKVEIISERNYKMCVVTVCNLSHLPTNTNLNGGRKRKNWQTSPVTHDNKSQRSIATNS